MTIAARRPVVVAACLAMLATLLVVVAPPPVADAASPRPWPALWDVRPATGEVVSAGSVRIAGTATAPSGIADVEVRVDDEVVAHSIADQNDTAARFHAPYEAAAGEHVVSVDYVATDGTRTQRTWRFAATDVGLHRLQGPDRYATAVEIASRGRDARAATAAVLARGDDHADALAGVPLAHHLDAPLLLTEGDTLSDVTRTALRDLVEPGGRVHLLGGGVAISAEVQVAVEKLGFDVQRHAGDSRYDTAAVIAAQLPDVTSAVVASGHSFPDALAAAAPAARRGQAILLSDRDTLPEATRATLRGLEAATLVGGEVVLSNQVQAQVDELAGTVDRVAGGDRYATAVEVVKAYGDLDTSLLGLASGQTFPDALAGALDAARSGTGLLLTDGRRLPSVTRGALSSMSPSKLSLYGGEVAVDRGVANEARAAVTDRGPRITSENPAATEEIRSLDQISLQFANELDIPKTSISVQFDGRELPTSYASGDFDDTLVLSIGALTTEPALGEAIPVRVVGTVHDGEGWTHVDRTWTYRKTSMSAGDQGAEVRALQDRLDELGYWLGAPDDEYGSLTVQAVMAFQKYEGLPITGAADDTTRQRLAVAQRPVPADGGGYHIEIDKSRQILMIAENGTTRWTFNTSTGSEIPYDEEGGSGTAVTPTGNFTVCHERDYLRESSLGTLWRPKYFHCGRGIAVHGATSVPGYPASHGCVRVTYAAMNFIWSQNMMPMGARVHVYGSIPGT